MKGKIFAGLLFIICSFDPCFGAIKRDISENFSLDEMEYQGPSTDEVYGTAELIKDLQGNVHRARIGEYIGKDFGRIIQINV